ncbi:hypothetical protein OG378_15525 [Streptomyces gougerotii]|nr:hypothetical protein OG378_15525 [Streptomyces gougerotii]
MVGEKLRVPGVEGPKLVPGEGDELTAGVALLGARHRLALPGGGLPAHQDQHRPVLGA